MDDTTREFLETLNRCFADLEDPRVQASCEHRLIDILAITILGVSCGADDWTDLEIFGRARHEWLQAFLPLPGGIPSHDTFGRVLGLLDRQQFAACLFQWTQAIHEATGGKALRSARSPTGSTKSPPSNAVPNANAWPAPSTPTTCSKSFTPPESMRKPWVSPLLE